MTSLVRVTVAGLVALSLLALPARAAEAGPAVTLTGRIACAACVLHLKGVTSCTNVLVVAEAGHETIYALAPNAVTKSWEMRACEHAVPVRVTGTITENASRKTIEATKIEKT